MKIVCYYLNEMVQFMVYATVTLKQKCILSMFKITVICYTKSLTEIYICYDKYKFLIWSSLNLIFYVYLRVSHSFKTNISNSS